MQTEKMEQETMKNQVKLNSPQTKRDTIPPRLNYLTDVSPKLVHPHSSAVEYTLKSVQLLVFFKFVGNDRAYDHSLQTMLFGISPESNSSLKHQLYNYIG